MNGPFHANELLKGREWTVVMDSPTFPTINVFNGKDSEGQAKRLAANLNAAWVAFHNGMTVTPDVREPAPLTRVVINNHYTYEATMPLKVGDVVRLPGADQTTGSWVGKVTAVGSEYEGPCHRVIGLAEPKPEPAKTTSESCHPSVTEPPVPIEKMPMDKVFRLDPNTYHDLYSFDDPDGPAIHRNEPIKIKDRHGTVTTVKWGTMVYPVPKT